MSTWQEEQRATKAMKAEQAREDRRLELDAGLKAAEIRAVQKRADDDAKAERARKDADAARRQELADKKQRDAEKAAAKLAKAAKRAKLTRWLKANPSTLFVAFVMVASIVPAVISQVGALSGASVNVAMAGLLAAMLEGGAWAITFMGKQAEDAGRETRKYRIATWATACAAAGVNFWHGLEQYDAHPWVAFVLGGSSLFAIYIWDMKTHGSHGKTRAEKQEAKARAKHLAKRRKDHKFIAKEADRLLSARPYGALTEEEAFETMWRAHKGAEPGLSVELYATATNARVALGAAFEVGEHVRPELLRTGMMAAALSPLPGRLADGLLRLGPVSPLPALTAGSQAPTGQTGIGSYASETPAAQGDGGALVRRSDQELDALLPDAHRAAAELVAEGRSISAAGLAKKLRVRREDGMRLRDLVVGERKLHAVAASDGTARKSVTAHIK